MTPRDAFDRLREHEKNTIIERDLLIENLLEELQEIRANYDELKKQRQRDIRVLTQYENESTDRDNENAHLKKSMGVDPFALVLIDGDVTLFKDEYIQDGTRGGEDAARDLQSAIQNYLNSLENLGYNSYWRTQVRVFSQLRGLSKTYMRSGVIPHESIFHSFVEGFNNSYELFEYVDAGTDKEGADNKIKNNLALMYNNVHCRHIMLAGSGDKGYTGPLRKYTLKDDKNVRLTLIETRPFPAQLKEVAEKFENAKFPTVFRSTPLTELPAPSPQTFASALTTSISPTQPKTAVPVVTSMPYNASTEQARQPDKASKDQRQVSVGFNKQGYRIDPKLPPCDAQKFQELKRRKLCNRHYLTQCTSRFCIYDHDSILKPGEVEILRHVARLLPCENLECIDPLCVAGHRCPYGPNCTYGSKCKFRKEAHHVDVNVHKSILMDIGDQY